MISQFKSVVGRMISLGYRRRYIQGYGKFYRNMRKSIAINEEMQSSTLLAEYRNKWAPIEKNCKTDAFQIYSSENGKIDLNYVPDYLYDLPIKCILLDRRTSPAYSDKNSYGYRLNGYANLFPDTLLRKMRGIYRSPDYSKINNLVGYISSIDEDKVVAKVAVDSAGGLGVAVFSKNRKNSIYTNDNGVELLSWMNGKEDVIVQKMCTQSSYFTKLNSSSVNTIRIVTYRSVKTEEIHITHSLIRVGASGSNVDNWHSGGLIVGIQPNGKLKDYGFNAYFEKIPLHTESQEVPCLKEIKDIAKEIGKKHLHHRMLSFDFYIDDQNSPKIMEINYDVSPWFQLVCGPLYGEFTDEVISYCADRVGYLPLSVPIK